jgi:hypothetical protein
MHAVNGLQLMNPLAVSIQTHSQIGQLGLLSTVEFHSPDRAAGTLQLPCKLRSMTIDEAQDVPLLVIALNSGLFLLPSFGINILVSLDTRTHLISFLPSSN